MAGLITGATRTIPVPHNMFANLESIWQLAESEGHTGRQPLRGLAFHSDVPPNSDAPAIDIDLRYRTTRINWVYDETTDPLSTLC